MCDGLRCPGARVGRIPIITWWAPTADDRASASFSDRRRFSSNVFSPESRNQAGGTLISMLNWPSSVWNAGSAIAANASAFFSAGSPLVDEVELDLQAGHRVVGVELVLAEHPLEHVEAAVDLLAIARAVGPRELLCVDVLPHAVTLGAPPRPGKRELRRSDHLLPHSGGTARTRHSARHVPNRCSGSTSKHRSSAHHARAPSPDIQAQNAVTASGVGHLRIGGAAQQRDPDA